MSDSLFAKRATLLNAIAITVLLALISGYLPLQGPSTWQSILPPTLSLGK